MLHIVKFLEHRFPRHAAIVRPALLMLAALALLGGVALLWTQGGLR